MKISKLKHITTSILFFCVISSAKAYTPPQIQLANLYKEGIKLDQYLVSEKLDGVRAYWDGQQFISKSGIIIRTPKWYSETMPKEHLDGELWIGRNKFEEISAASRTKNPEDKVWKEIKFMIFDMPQHKGNFIERIAAAKKLIAESKTTHLQLIEQFKVVDHKSLMQHLNKIIKEKGEGLMLRKINAPYEAKRNDNLLKLKAYEDSEARVLSVNAGKGKYKGMMGSLTVINKEGVKFKIGTGFTTEQRKNPPHVGDIITYKFHGKTKKNTPKYPSFMRIYHE